MSQQGDDLNLNKDALGGDQTLTTSKAGKGTSKEGKPITLPQKDYQKLKSDAEASAGRAKDLATTRAERDTLTGQVQTLTSRLEAVETESRNRAFDEARRSGDSGAIQAFERTDRLNQQEKTLIDGQAELKRGQLQLRADQEELSRTQVTLTIPKIVAKYKLDEAAQTHLEELGITDEDALDKVAARIAGTKAIPTDLEKETVEGEEIPTVKTFEPISTESTGAREIALTSESAEKMPTKDLEKELAPPPK